MTMSPSDGRKTLLIYRSYYGQLSETFVRDHVHGLDRYQPLVLANRIDPRGPAETAEVVTVPNGGRLSRRLWNWGLARGVDRLLQQRKPALIHAHFLFDGVSILPYARRHDIPLVVTAHGFDATTYPEVLAQSEEGRQLLTRQRDLAEQAALILCVSDFIRDEMIARGYPAEKLLTHPLGVYTSSIQPDFTVQRSGILTVGRLVEKKGTRFLIEAYARLPEALRAQHPLTVIGDGPLRAELEALAVERGVAVNFCGGQPRERIFAELKKTAAFCLPSIRAQSGDAEGMPIAIMEALAFATPTLIFDDQPAAPLFLAEQAGLVARARDVADLARQLEHALTSPETPAMGQRGRALCETRFDIVRNNAGLEDIYDRLLG